MSNNDTSASLIQNLGGTFINNDDMIGDINKYKLLKDLSKSKLDSLKIKSSNIVTKSKKNTFKCSS